MSARLVLCCLVSLAALLAVGASVPVRASTPTSSLSPLSPQWDPTCYSTYDQIDTILHNTALEYPHIATVIDGGLAWEGTRHIWALKLETSVNPGPKPGIFLVAGQHPRDIATTEMLLRLVAYLTRSYGTDPDVTWLLDNRTLTIIPSGNPDGYYSVYNFGYNQFKNRNNNYCPNGVNRGADIDRNYPFQWNTVGGSPNACDASYPGPSPLSEPESASILSIFQSSGAGLLINLQATGPGVLYPWGYTPTPPPDAGALFALGWAFGRLNGTPGFEVRTQNSHVPISGIIDDTAYGQYGVPAYTFNIGLVLSPTCADLDPLWNAQRPAFLYAAKAAALNPPSTFAHAYGPNTTGLSVTPAGTNAITLTAVLSSNIGTVAGAVYAIDNPGGDGSGVPIPGGYGGGTATVAANIDTSALPAGRHLALVQGRNNANQWGVFSSTFFTVTAVVPTFTATGTPISPPTSTSTPAPPTATPMPSSTLPSSPTGTVPPTVTVINSTHTPTPSPTPAATRTGVPTSTSTSTATSFPFSTATTTVTPTVTLIIGTHTTTRTITPSATVTDTPTTGIPSETPTRLLTGTRTPTETRTPTNTSTPTETRSPTDTRTPTYTRTATNTPTLTSTLTGTGSPTYTRTPTFTHTPAPPSSPTPLPCITFTDVNPSNYFYHAVDWLYCRGLITGYADNTFRPNNTATRAQILKIVVRGQGWPIYTPPTPTFLDVAPFDWFYSYVETALAHNIVTGYADNTFRPNNPVTRAQLSKITVLAFLYPLLNPPDPSFTDVPPGSPFYTYIETARAHNLVSGYGDLTFHPNNNATRGQLSKILYTAFTQP